MINPSHVVSADGTRIGWVQRGQGPMLVLVHGATADHTRWAGVDAQLAARFTLRMIDRRGRGLSRDENSGPYRIAAEADDVRAVVAAAAEAQAAPVFLLGHSYGGLCVLDAARDNATVAKLMVYEPAFATPGLDVIGPEALTELSALIAAGQRDTALEQFFVRVIGVPAKQVAMMKTLPIWQQRLDAVHTLVREGAAANAWQPLHLAELTMPLRILLGSVSPPWLQAAARAAHRAAPASSLVELPGQAHGAMDSAPQMFVDEVTRFFLS
ncbi:alpha/beta hydrolase [Nevskia sp.]|uniref:alpha/beta fold hydrolase n=1 Tax=Nevskia sp. TaxID=1929292 RepID=UPI0025E69B8D|nr:alpha/beta hydrolase [Nevskia sp.]